MTQQTVYGIVPNRAAAEKVIQALINSGISKADISFLASQGEDFREIPIEARDWRNEDRVTGTGGLGTEKHSKLPEGATTGAATGGIIGGTLGLLAGLGALAIPGAGPFIAAGPILAALSGTGIGGALGGVIGGLVGWGIPEYEAKRYEDRLKAGGVLLAICCLSDDLAKKVKDVLIRNGAQDVNISSSSAVAKDYHKH